MTLQPKLNVSSLARAPIRVWHKPTQQVFQPGGLYIAARSSIKRNCLSSQTSYFDILGVAESASQEEIKSAFRSKSKVLHPDVNKQPSASRDFMALRRAYTVLSSPELRAEYEAQLGLPSARARDPRFARFERWRREVIPDLRLQLEVWSVGVQGFMAAWREAVELRERTLAHLQDVCVTLLTQIRAAASVTADDLASCSELSQQHQQELLASANDALEAMRREIAGVVSDSGDGAARVEREGEKRYQQLCSRYPAYPDIVWLDVWEETSDMWLEQSQAEAQRCAEAALRWSACVQELQLQLHMAVGPCMYGSCSGAGAGHFHEA